MQEVMQADLALPNNGTLVGGQIPAGMWWYGLFKVIQGDLLFVSSLLDKADSIIVGLPHLLPDLMQSKVQLKDLRTSCCCCCCCGRYS